LSLTGVGNVVDANWIFDNGVGIAVRPTAPSTVVRLSRNRISGNGQSILRCHAGHRHGDVR